MRKVKLRKPITAQCGKSTPIYLLLAGNDTANFNVAAHALYRVPSG